MALGGSGDMAQFYLDMGNATTGETSHCLGRRGMIAGQVVPP
jgi:hypothetical protein